MSNLFLHYMSCLFFYLPNTTHRHQSDCVRFRTLAQIYVVDPELWRGVYFGFSENPTNPKYSTISHQS